MNRELFIKYIQNRCNSEELERVIDWFKGEAGMISGRCFLNEFWEEMRDDENYLDENAILLLHRIHHDLNVKKSEMLLQKSNNNPVKFIKRKVFLHSLMKVAAILFIPLLFVSVYLTTNQFVSKDYFNKDHLDSYTKIYSPVGSISQVDLPDGTTVWLNHNTTLTYPRIFSKYSRDVNLKGEAYFVVKNNQKVPFIVHTDKIDIVATGTAFNVMAFPDVDRIETTLTSGKVLLKKKSPDGKSSVILEMRPNEHAVYDLKTHTLEHGYENINKHILWKDGRLIFENDPLDRVAERLSRFYNVDITIRDPILSNYTYTATFIDETLPQVMELLKIATPIRYSISSRQKLEDGSFSKRKVIIKYNGK